MASTKTIPNLADDDESDGANTLVGTLAPEDTLVGSVPKAPGVDDDEDDTAHENTLVGDPWDTTEVTGRPSEVRALKPTPRTPPSRANGVTAKPPTAKPTREPAKRTVPRATPKVPPAPAAPPPVKEEDAPREEALAPSIPPPLAPSIPPPFTPAISPPRAASFPPPMLVATEAPLDQTAPLLSTAAPRLESAAEDDAAFRRLSAGPISRSGEVLLAVLLFLGYLSADLVTRFVGLCRPLWAQASRDASARIHRR